MPVVRVPEKGLAAFMGDDVVNFRGRGDCAFIFAGFAEWVFFEEPCPRFAPLVVVERLVVLLAVIVDPFAWLYDLLSMKHGKFRL